MWGGVGGGSGWVKGRMVLLALRRAADKRTRPVSIPTAKTLTSAAETLTSFGLLVNIGACMTQLVFLTNLVKKVGGVFEAARVTSDCVGDHNACAAADNGHLATGGLVAGPEALAHLHFSSRCGPSQFVRRIWHIGGGTGAYKAVRGGGPGMSPGAKGKRHCIVSSVISHGGKQQERRQS